MVDQLAPTERPFAPDPAFDARVLFAQGLEHVRALARAQWTDHNAHDPGITILELVAYALTELAYRNDFPIEDLVARAGASDPETAELTAAQFHRASAILPNRPWTAGDWRRALIDLKGVKNAWIEADDGARLIADLRQRELRRDPPDHEAWTEVVLRGPHRVRIEFMDRVSTPAQRKAVLAEVRAALQSQRNLCEDFTEVRVAKAQYFSLCAEIDLDTGADVTEAAAQLLFDLAHVIAPPVLNHTLAKMLARGATLPDLLEGPRLTHGLIDDAELAATTLPHEIRLSDLIGVAMDVPGIRAVRDLLLSPLERADEEDELAPDADPSAVLAEAVSVANPWRVPVRPGRLPRLSFAHGRLVFSKRGMPVAGWPIAAMPVPVRKRLEKLRDEARVKVETPTPMDPPLPVGRVRELAAWRSFQHDFPVLYGIGASGLPGRPDDARRAQALQLKGYLLFLDQWLADQLATLAQAGRRLSVAPADLQATAKGWTTKPKEQHTLESQVVVSVVDHDQLYPAGVTPRQLADCAESPSEAATRQQGLLDHLLARVGEDFAEYVAVVASAFGGGAPKAIADKCAFLEDVAALGRDRAGAHHQFPDSGDGAWNTDNVSGLERRLARLLGIADFTRRNLSSVSYDTYAEVDATPGDEFRFRVRHRVTGQILLSSSTNYVTRDQARAEMLRALERGQLAEGYQRLQTTDGRHYFNVVDATGEVLTRRIQYFDSAATLDEAIAELIAYLREHYSGEGLYVVEHLLLRPIEPDDPLLPICTDPGCDDCTDTDPYSYRLHVVLPAHAARFQNPAFRNFVEETIRREMPAHLLPTVCWIGTDDMARFERAWREWIELHAGLRTSGRKHKLQALIDALVSVKNIYPARALFDCSADEDKPPFILGKTSLGSAQ